MKTQILKSTLKYVALTLIAIISFSCQPEEVQGEQGPIGEQGPQGEKGDKGENGNANVYASDWLDTNFNPNSTLTRFDIAEEKITQDIVDTGTVIAFGKLGDYTISIPFTFSNKTYYTATKLNTIRFIAHSIDGNPKTFDDINKVRYVIIPASTSSRLAVDYTRMSYNELMDHFGLEK